MELLGEDGLGYELALRLEDVVVWREWLGETSYASFVPFLSSAASWKSLMKPSSANPDRSLLILQLKVRGLLLNKALGYHFHGPHPHRSSLPPLSQLNPSFLQLHGDDVYYTLEDDSEDETADQETSVPSNSAQSKAETRTSFGPFDQASNAGSRYIESKDEHVAHRLRHNESSENWYDQYARKFRAIKRQISATGEKELYKRTPDGMSEFLKLNEKHRKRSQVFKNDPSDGFSFSTQESGSHRPSNSIFDLNKSADDENFFPEVMFPLNCVPNIVPCSERQVESIPKVDCYGVLDNLPLASRNAAMIERFGIRPEYLRMGLGRSKCRELEGTSEGNGKSLSQEQAFHVARKTVARVFLNVGIEGSSEFTLNALSQFLCSHISKLGGTLKLLTDSYGKHLTATQLLKMFFNASGLSIEDLAELTRDGTIVRPSHAQQPALELQPLHPSPNLPSQQMQRPLLPQMQTMLNQNMQQWRRQISTGVILENRSMLDVKRIKTENTSEIPVDVMLGATNKQPLQFRQQQMFAANHHIQPCHQLKQMPSIQLPQVQAQNSFATRTPPVKVEGFQELMGGDSISKHDPVDHKLTSPSK